MKEVTYEEWVKNPTPREMWVWDNNVEEKKKEKVIAILEQKNIKHRVLAVQGDYEYVKRFNHCAEIEEPKKRRMTNQEFSWWLREKPTREWTFQFQKSAKAHNIFEYFDNEANLPIDDDILIRENNCEWHEPLVEAE